MNRFMLTVCSSILMLHASAQIPNPGFELWDSSQVVDGETIYNPVDWSSSNSDMVSFGKEQPITITTDAHSGDYAVQITTIQDDGGQPAGIMNSGNDYGKPLDKTEKFKLTGKIKSYRGWYKYEPNGTDSFKVTLMFFLKGQYYGRAYYTGGASNTYQQFDWILTYPDNIPLPDSAKFMVHSSIYQGAEGSILKLDDMEIGYANPSALNEAEQEKIYVYPNPASKEIHCIGLPPRYVRYAIMNAQGKVVSRDQLRQDKVNISDLDQGMYFITFEGEEGHSNPMKFIKQ